MTDPKEQIQAPGEGINESLVQPDKTPLDVAAIQARVDATTEGPWFYNSYNGIFSAPKMRTYDAWFDTIPEGHTVERRGECPLCGRWKQIACVAPESYEHGCKYFSDDYERDPEVAWVPSHHGDTAIGKRAADAEFIAHARTDIPLLLAEVRVLQERIRKALELLGETECGNCDHPAKLHDPVCTHDFRGLLCGCDWRGQGYGEIVAILSGSDTAANTEEPDDSENLITLTKPEWDAAARERLAELGISYAELAQMARDQHFTSTAARKLWVLIGGTLDEERTDG